MKRSTALVKLSQEHHHALVLTQRIAKADTAAIPLLMAAVPAIFAYELEPHFRTEEETLLPRLEAAGQINLVRRAAEEHRLLRVLAERIASGDRSALQPFGSALKDHVRFEERELFAAAERVLAADFLAGLSIHHPNPSNQ